MEVLEAKFTLLTPMFGGGADSQVEPEVRAPAVKAALRYWYRAIQSTGRADEARLFGSVGQEGNRQSSFLVRVMAVQYEPELWDRGRLDGFNHYNALNPRYSGRPAHSNQSSGTWMLNGVRYFGYPFAMRGGERRAVPAGTRFTVRLVFRRRPGDQVQRALAAALWLLGHVGGLGARMRRGFGSLSLDQWEIEGGAAWGALATLPLAAGAADADDWLTRLRAGRGVIQTWFPDVPAAGSPDHAILGQNSWISLRTGAKCDDWESALDCAGKAMQEFRQRHGMGNTKGDYETVKAHIVNKDTSAARTSGANDVAAAMLPAVARRAAFGLPLTFRYSSLSYDIPLRGGGSKRMSPSVEFTPVATGRSASRVHARIVRIAEDFYPLFVRLSGPLVGNDDKVNLSGPGRFSAPYNSPDDSILADFRASLDAGWTTEDWV